MNSKLPPAYKAPAAAATSSAAPSTAPAVVKKPLPPAASAANKPATTSQKAVVAPAPKTAAAPVITTETLMQRGRYFETLATQYEKYIEQLQATIKRQGGAVPTAYFAPLKGAAGSYTPKVAAS